MEVYTKNVLSNSQFSLHRAQNSFCVENFWLKTQKKFFQNLGDEDELEASSVAKLLRKGPFSHSRFAPSFLPDFVENNAQEEQP
jgi:hypothetical protein